METLAASSLHFSLMRWPALRHSPLEHQQGTLSCGVQAPLHPLPPVPGRGQHPRHRQSLVSQHARTSRSFRQLFGRPAVFKLKMEFPQRFCLLAVAAGVSAAPGDSPAEHSPAGAAGQPRLPAPLQPGRGGERRERRIRGRAADPCPPGEGGCGPRSVTSAERGRHPAGAGGAAGGRWDAHGFSLNSRALLSAPGSGPMGEGEQGSPPLLEFGIDFWPLLWLRIPPVPFCHLPGTPFLLGNY